jgi:hypothetical protein
MSKSLQQSAEEILDIFASTETMPNRLLSRINVLQYTPRNIHSAFKKSKVVRKGFRLFFSTIVECLQSKRCPTADNLMDIYRAKRAWPQMHLFYFSRGGSIESAFKVVLDLAQQNFQVLFGCVEDRSLSDLRCRNDYEFAMVRRLCTTDTSDAQETPGSMDQLLS